MYCIDKVRNKSNQIVEYVLQDDMGAIQHIKPERLKQALAENSIQVTNLKLTETGRLVEKKVKGYYTLTYNFIAKLDLEMTSNKQRLSLSFQSNVESVERVLGKYRLAANAQVKQLNKHVGQINLKNQLIIVSDYQLVFDFTKRVKVIGRVFCSTRFMDIDLSNTLNRMSNLKGFFLHCKAATINIGNFNTDIVTDMSSLFFDCNGSIRDVEHFNTSNVRYMNYMFANSYINNDLLRAMDTSKVVDMTGMFMNSNTQFLDISHFDTTSLKKYDNMFDGCTAKAIHTNDARLEKAFENRKMGGIV